MSKLGQNFRKKILIALDFDHTIIHDNSDTSIYKLAPGQKIPPELKALYCTSGWTHYMSEVFKYLHSNGVTEKDILNCLDELPLTDGMAELFNSLPSDQTEIIIISDANTLFIDHILKNKGIHHKVSAVFTNYAKFETDGLLTLEMYHKQDKCNLSTINLCKGSILSQFVSSKFLDGIDFVNIAYIGDGYNDFCPMLRLRECDGAFPRLNYNLIDTIQNMEKERHLKLKAKVYPWSSGRDIISIVLPWYDDINDQLSPSPKLFDPGVLID